MKPITYICTCMCVCSSLPTPLRSSPPLYAPNFVFSVSQKKEENQNKYETYLKMLKNKAKTNKETWSLFCLSQLLLAMERARALECG